MGKRHLKGGLGWCGALLMVTTLGLGACGTSSDGGKASVATMPEAISRAQRDLREGLSAGTDAQRDNALNNIRSYTARHNPARCQCPEMEIFVAGRWERVFTFDPPTGQTSMNVPVEPRDDVFELRARLMEREFVAPNQLSYRAVVLEGVEEGFEDLTQ